MRVPVLSRRTASTLASASIAVPLRNRSPSCAALPVATRTAIGVARPIAHGHAATSTESAATKAKLRRGSGPKTSQATKVSAERASTMGTKTAAMASAVFWMGALDPWACSTLRTIWLRKDASPTCEVFTVMRPCPLTVPPITASPGCFSTGMGSPVTMDSSTKVAPSSATPSTATRSPGRTTTTSPTAMDAIGTSISAPSRRTRADFAWSFSSASMAAEARPLARASRCLPRSTSVTMALDTSK